MGAPAKVGLEFRVNTGTAFTQRDGDVAVLADGRIVVTWTDNNFPNWQGSSGIKGKILNADGSTSADDFVVRNNFTGFVGGAYSPAVTGLADGRFIAAQGYYYDSLGPSSGREIAAQMFNPGSPPTTSGSQLTFATQQPVGGSQNGADPDVAQLSNGNIVMVWYENQAGEPVPNGIRYAIFTPSGTPILTETALIESTIGPAEKPAVEALANGGFAISFIAVAGAGDQAAFVNTYNAAGVEQASGLQIDLLNLQTNAADVAAVAGGGYAIAYTEHLNGMQLSIAWKDVPGVTNGNLVIDAGVGSGAPTTAIDAVGLADGRIFVVWADGSVGTEDSTGLSNRAILGQMLKVNAGGTAYEKDGATILINTFTANDQIEPHATVLADGRIMVTWTSSSGVLDNDGMGISAQILDPRESGLYLTGLDKQWYGTPFTDVLTGTANPNHLSGGGGNDFIWGFGNNDILNGNAGIDYLDGGDGNDYILGGDDGDNLQGGAGSDYLNGGAGHDFIFGLDGDDVLYGDATVDEAGIDTILGGNGNDAVLGMSGSDVLYGDAGIDTLLGGSGVDWLFGGTGNDVLYGEADQDFIHGEQGSDYIYSGTGVDYIYFEPEAGTDTLADWTNGQDILVFQGFGYTSMANLTIADGGGYVAITYSGNTLFVLGATASQFDPNDFIFF